MHAHELPFAVSELVERGEWAEAVHLIDAHWDAVIGTDPADLLAALEQLPAAVLLANPHLVVAAPRLTRYATTDATSPSADPLSGPLDGSAAGLVRQLSSLTRRSRDARHQRDAQAAAAIAQEARNLLDDSAPAVVGSITGLLPAHSLEWARSLDAGASAEARIEYRRAYELARACDLLSVAARAAARLSWVHAEFGRTDAAETWIARAGACGSDSLPLAPTLLAEAVLRIDRDDAAAARALVARAEAGGLGDHWAAALWVRSLLAHDVAEAAVVEAMIADRLGEHPGVLDERGFDGRLLRAARVRVLLLRGRIDRDLDTYVEHSMSDRVISAAIALFQGRHRQALRLSQPATDDGVEPRLQSNALLIEAAAALALGYEETAGAAFRRADALIQRFRLLANYESIPAASLAQLVQLTGAETSGVVRVHSARRDVATLSARENDVLVMLATDLSMEQIAEKLFVTRNTLKTLTRRLYRKLGVTSRAAAVDYAQSARFGEEATADR